MKTKIYLFAGMLFLSTVFQLKAQEMDYSTYYHEGVQWRIGEYLLRRFVRVSNYEVKGDSVVDEKYYNKLYCDNRVIGLLRNEGGNIYYRQIVSGEPYTCTWKELLAITTNGSLHKDYLVGPFVNEWKDTTPIAYSIWKNGLGELVKDTIRDDSLEVVRLDNGKFYKKYKDIIYGFGDYQKGPLGMLIYEDNEEAGIWRGEVEYRLIDLYDNGELIFRSKTYEVSGLGENPEDSPDIRIFYSPVNKSLQLVTSLSEASYTVDLFRVDGTKTLSFSGSSYSLSGLSPGIYLVRICTASKCLYTSKIRVE